MHHEAGQGRLPEQPVAWQAVDQDADRERKARLLSNLEDEVSDLDLAQAGADT